jgi:hypothetical protein
VDPTTQHRADTSTKCVGMWHVEDFTLHSFPSSVPSQTQHAYNIYQSPRGEGTHAQTQHAYNIYQSPRGEGTHACALQEVLWVLGLQLRNRGGAVVGL